MPIGLSPLNLAIKNCRQPDEFGSPPLVRLFHIHFIVKNGVNHMEVRATLKFLIASGYKGVRYRRCQIYRAFISFVFLVYDADIFHKSFIDYIVEYNTNKATRPVLDQIVAELAEWMYARPSVLLE